MPDTMGLHVYIQVHKEKHVVGCYLSVNYEQSIRSLPSLLYTSQREYEVLDPLMAFPDFLDLSSSIQF